MGKQKLLAFLAAFMTLVFMPSAYAGPFSTIIQVLAKVTYVPELNNPAYRVVFYRFCFFIIFLTIFNVVLKNSVFKKIGSDAASKRAPTIIAIILALIGAMAMPAQYMLVTGELWMIVIALLASLSIPIALIWIGMKLSDEWWKELLGFALVLLAWAMFNAIQVNFNYLIITSFQTGQALIQEIADWTTIIFLIFAIVKLIRVFGGGGKIGEAAGNLLNGLSGSSDPSDDSSSSRGPKTPAEKSPSQPLNFGGHMLPPNPPGEPMIIPTDIELWWDNNGSEEEVTHYEIFFHSKGFTTRGITKGHRLWKKVSVTENHSREHPWPHALPEDTRIKLQYLKDRNEPTKLIMWIRAVNARGKHSGFTSAVIVQENNHPLVIQNELHELGEIATEINAIDARLEAVEAAINDAIMAARPIGAVVRADFDHVYYDNYLTTMTRCYAFLNAMRERGVADVGPVELSQLVTDTATLNRFKANLRRRINRILRKI